MVLPAESPPYLRVTVLSKFFAEIHSYLPGKSELPRIVFGYQLIHA